MRPQAEPTIARLSEAPAVSFGPLAHYQRLTGEDGLPVFTGVQTCRPGYATPLHWHPYVEYLFVLYGTMEAWLEGQGHARAPEPRRHDRATSVRATRFS